MKTVLCAVNSAYIHKSLSLLKLSAFLKREVTCLEYTINQPRDFVYNSLLEERAEVYCFSTYIWNISFIEAIAQRLKRATGAIIIFGGPEAGGEAVEYSESHPYVDYVIKGDGEVTLDYLLSAIENGEETIKDGIYHNGQGKGVSERAKSLPMPYSDESLSKEDKIIYYETSRGCFNKCAYCVSGCEDVILYDAERVEKELSHMAEFDIPLIKLVDRSFNAYGKRSERMLSFLAKETKNTAFHLEVAPDLFSEEMLETIKNAPEEKFQFEAGIQSLNEDTLKAIGRICDNKKAFSNLEKIIAFDNCKVHVDILAGLPKEDIKSFTEGFNKTYSLKAYHMDVGFLKVLKGTSLFDKADELGIEYETEPPYEVIKTKEMSAFDILRIKKVHTALERIYNSHSFENFITALEREYEDYFLMYERLSLNVTPGMSQSALFSHLAEGFPHLKRELILDFMLSGEKKPPIGFDEIKINKFSEKCIEFLSEYREELFPQLKDEHPCLSYKKLKFYAFSEGVFVSDRKAQKVFEITDCIKL